MVTKILPNESVQTGIYYDGGHPIHGSTAGRDPTFADHLVAETRAVVVDCKRGVYSILA